MRAARVSAGGRAGRGGRPGSASVGSPSRCGAGPRLACPRPRRRLPPGRGLCGAVPAGAACAAAPPGLAWGPAGGGACPALCLGLAGSAGPRQRRGCSSEGRCRCPPSPSPRLFSLPGRRKPARCLPPSRPEAQRSQSWGCRKLSLVLESLVKSRTPAQPEEQGL